MQIAHIRTGSSGSIVAPGGLAGWVLGILRGHETRKSTKHLHIVESLSLGAHRHLTLITCDGERFLVGGGADGIETIVRVAADQPTETA